MVLELQGFLLGMLMVPLSSPCPMVDNSASMLAAEATAATDCLQLVLSGRHHKAILKSDSSQLVQLWQKQDFLLSKISPFIRRSRRSVAAYFLLNLCMLNIAVMKLHTYVLKSIRGTPSELLG
jgi:hypothetical protein